MVPGRKSRENTTLAYHNSRSRAAQTTKVCTWDAFLFYLGHTKFPDRMASRTARVRKPIYKYTDVTDAIQAHRFVNLPDDRSTRFTEKTVRKVSCRRLARFFPFNNYVECRHGYWLHEHPTQRNPRPRWRKYHRPTTILTTLIYARQQKARHFTGIF